MHYRRRLLRQQHMPRSLHSATCANSWFGYWLFLLTQLSFPQSTVPVYEDNQPCIDSLMAHRNSQRTRHYDIRYFWVRELIGEQKIIDLKNIHTKENYADFRTKILPKDEMLKAIQSFMFQPLQIKIHHSSKEDEI